MAEKPTKGTIVSFGNTPQAKDDILVGLGTEDSGVIFLNVMANDLAGNGKTLWATDDGISEGGDRPADLLVQDAIDAVGISALGARIWITADGRVAYHATAAMVAAHQSLSVGQSITDSFTYAIQMGNGTLSWAKVNLTLAGTNDAPVVQNVSIAAVEDGPAVTGSFIGDDVDSDDDSSSLTYTLTAQPAVGTLTKSGTSFTYAPGSNFQGLAAGEQLQLGFEYTATDKHGAVSTPASGTITVTGVNDAPTLAAAALTTMENAAVALNLATLGDDVDSDNDGSNLMYSTAAPGASISGTTLSFDPASNFDELAQGASTTVVLQLTATDKHGATATNAVTVTVNGTNDAPTLKAGTLGVLEDGPAATLALTTLGGDIDSDDDANSLAYSLVAPVQGATIVGNVLSFDPDVNYQGLASGETSTLAIDVKATDKHGASVVNTVTVTVTGQNDDPTLLAGKLAVFENGVPRSLDLSDLGDDIDSDDDGSTLVYSAPHPVPPGTSVTVTGTTFTFDPGTAFDQLPEMVVVDFPVGIVATDKHGDQAFSHVDIRLIGKNDAPTMNAGTLTTKEDSSIAANLNLATLADDIDNDDAGGSLTYTLKSPAPVGGSLVITGSGLNFHPGAGFQGLALDEALEIPLLIEAKDKHGATAMNTVTLTVQGNNDAPVLGTATIAISEDGGPAIVNLALIGNDIDSDNDGSDLTYKTSGVFESAVTVAGTSLKIDPGTGYQYLGAGEGRTFSIPVTATDRHGASASNVVKVLVSGKNDAPRLGGDLLGGVTALAGDQSLKVQQWTGFFGPHDETTIRNFVNSNAADYIVSSTVIDFTDDPGGFAGEIPGSMPWPAAVATGASGTAGINDAFVARITGQISVAATDTYTFRTYNDDGVHLRVNDQLLISDSTHHPEAPFTGSITLAPGVYSVDLLYFEGGGEASLEFTYRNSTGNYGHVVSTQQLGDSGFLNFGDVDLNDTHTVTVTPVGSTLGALSATMTNASTGDGTGNIAWNYAVDNEAVVSLGAGQQKVETFTVTLADNHGGTAAQNVAVTITGINDGPTAVNDANALKVTSLASQVNTTTVKWVDWTQQSPGVVKGVIDLGGGQTIDVTYTGQYGFAQTSGGIDYYTTPATQSWDLTLGTGTYTSAGVSNGPTGSDIIAQTMATTRTLKFSQPVDDLFFAVVSLNGNGYRFDQDFDILSYGRGYFDNGGATKNALPDGRYELLSVANSHGSTELHGVIGVKGSVTSLTWDSLSNENWNGFTVGTYGKAQTAVATGNLLANDTDPDAGDTLSIHSVNGQGIAGNSLTLTLGSGARLTVNRNGTYDYDENGAFAHLAADQVFSDLFTYTVQDSHGAVSNLATVTINVTGINDAPVAKNDAVTTQQNVPLTINVLANDYEAEGDALTLQSVTQGAKGNVTIVNNQAVYTPKTNLAGNDSFSYTVKDIHGATSTATVNVTVANIVDTYTPMNLVKNGSFEQTTSGVNVNTGTTILNGWTVPNEWQMTGHGVDVVNNWQGADGNVSLDLNAFNLGGVTQHIPTMINTVYQVSFMLSKNPGGGNQTFSDVVRVGFDAQSADFTFASPNTNTNMMWQQKLVAFAGDADGSELSFTSLTPAGAGNGDIREGAAIDEVVVVKNDIVMGFMKGAGGDVLNLSSILASVNAPHDPSAFSTGHLLFTHNNGNTQVRIDPNGGSDGFLTVATLIGVQLLESDTGNYIL